MKATLAHLMLLSAVGLVLGGCGTQGPTPSAASARNPASGVPSNAADNRLIDIEQQWLLSFFSGTPVEIQRTNAALSVVVPAEFCFDAGSVNIKPPLAKVLEKLAESLRRRPQLRVATVAAPPDATGDATLAVKRAKAVQNRLRNLGVASQRLDVAKASSAAEVRLLLQMGVDPG